MDRMQMVYWERKLSDVATFPCLHQSPTMQVLWLKAVFDAAPDWTRMMASVQWDSTVNRQRSERSASSRSMRKLEKLAQYLFLFYRVGESTVGSLLVSYPMRCCYKSLQPKQLLMMMLKKKTLSDWSAGGLPHLLLPTAYPTFADLLCLSTLFSLDLVCTSFMFVSNLVCLFLTCLAVQGASEPLKLIVYG